MPVDVVPVQNLLPQTRAQPSSAGLLRQNDLPFREKILQKLRKLRYLSGFSRAINTFKRYKHIPIIAQLLTARRGVLHVVRILYTNILHASANRSNVAAGLEAHIFVLDHFGAGEEFTH